LAAVLAILSFAPRAKAQTWADAAYRYRRPLVISSTVPEGLKAGDVFAFPYVPNYGPFEGHTRADGRDVKVIYHNGAETVEPPQVVLPMGNSSARVLFAIAAPVGAPPPYSLVETAAGKTDYASLPAGSRLNFPSTAAFPLDDNVITVTLPFAFPLRDTQSNKLTIAIDGYAGIGPADPGRPDNDHNKADQYIVMPWQSDFAITDPSMGVYLAATTSEAVIRWEVQQSASGPIIARFAAILKPDGSIRFVYGAPVHFPEESIADPDNGGYDPVRHGVGVGDPTRSLITQEAYTLDGPNDPAFTNHADILFTQSFSRSNVSGYWAYYGNGTDDGARTAPTAGLQGVDFADGLLHGFESLQDPAGTGTASSDVQIVNGAFGNELRLNASKYHHPTMYWKDMTPVGQGVTYTRLRCGGEYGVFQRFNTQTLTSSVSTVGAYLTGADIPGAGVDYTSFGGVLAMPIVTNLSQAEENGIRHPGPDALEGWVRYKQNDLSAYQYQIQATVDDAVSGHTFIKAKAWPSVADPIPTDPGRWLVNRDTAIKASATQPLVAGKVGFSSYLTDVFVKSVYVVANPYAEDLVFDAGAEETAPIPAGKGVIQGTVTDAATGAGIPNVSVGITPSGGGTSLSAATDGAGQYQQFADPGSYTLSFLYNGYAVASGSATLAAGDTAVVDAVLAARNLLLNSGFETQDASFSGKPKSWYRRNLGANSEPNATAVTAPWEYIPFGHTGSKSVGISGSSGVASWEIEGNQANVNNADNRGRASFAATVAGDTYRVSAWLSKTGPGGSARVVGHPMTGPTDADSNVAPGAQYAEATDATGGWVQLTKDVAATSSFMSVRLYGTDIPSGQHAYWDDVSLTRVQTPVYTGLVRDSSGAPVAGAAVALRRSTADAVAEPLMYATTDGVGRFQFAFIPTPGVQYSVQAWLDGYAASSNTALAAPGARTIVVYDASAAANIAAGKTVAAFSSASANEPAANAVDGDPSTRWASDGGSSNPRGYPNPQFLVVDLGQRIDFAEVSQVILRWETARADGYELRVSDAAPSPTMDAAAAAGYGTRIYAAPSGAAGYTPPGTSGVSIDVLTPPALGRAKGRYLMLFADKYVAGLTNFSVFELRVDVPVGTVSGTVVDAVTGMPAPNVFVGPQPFTRAAYTPSLYVVTNADGQFTYSGPAIPLQMAAHKGRENTDPYLLTQFTAAPSLAGANAGVILIAPSNVGGDPEGNAFRRAATTVIDNQAHPGADTYLPTTATEIGRRDPDGDPLGILEATPDRAADGDPATEWDINTDVPDRLDATRVPYITEGAGYKRFGLLIEPAAPATLTEIDIFWQQNGMPLGYYVEVQRPGSSAWERVFEVLGRVAGYGAKDYVGGDGNTVTPIKFAPRPVAKARLIFTRHSDRSYNAPNYYGTEVRMGEVFGVKATAASARIDALAAWRIAAGLTQGDSTAVTRLDVTGDGLVSLTDVLTLWRQAAL
jgi:hypothetical protein